MKQLLFLLVINFSVLQAFGQTVDSSFAGPYYLKQEAYFKNLPKKKHPMVFLGNSITEVGDWQELFSSRNILNRGISGDNTYGVINRLPSVLELKPKKIFLAIGVNDIKRGTSLGEISRNHERIIKTIKAGSPKTKLYLQSILPVNESMLAEIYKKITNERIGVVNERLRQLAVKFNCEYVDLHQSLLKGSDGQLKKEFSTDGLHLQPEAYIIWAQFIKSKNYLQ